MGNLGQRARAVIQAELVFRVFQVRKVNVDWLESVSRACLVIMVLMEHQVFLEQRVKLVKQVCRDWPGLRVLKDFPE